MSGNLKQFRADNPKLSGRERAQQMARARLAAKKVDSNTPTPTKTTVEKPAGTPPPQNNQSSGSNTVPSGSFGISAKGKEQAAKNKAAVANNQSGSGNQRRPISPQMQKRLAATRVGDNAAAAVNKIKPKPGQTVTTQQTPRGTTATLTSSAGSLQKNKQKANRVANAMNKQGANVSVGKIDDF